MSKTTTQEQLYRDTQASEPVQTATLSVDAGTKISTFSNDMLGVAYGNWEFNKAWGKPFLGSQTMQPLTDAMKKIDSGIIRYAGGNWINDTAWSREPQRRPSDGGFTIRGRTYKYHFGTDEMEYLNKYADEIGAEVMIQVNLTENDPEMWADMVRYVNVEKGYNFKYWELGNENEATWNEYLEADEYMRRFQSYAGVMRSVDPNIIIVGNGAASAYEEFRAPESVVTELRQIPQSGGDGITWHWYLEWQDNSMNKIFRYSNPGAHSLTDPEHRKSRQWGDIATQRIEEEALDGTDLLHGVTEINTLAENRNHIQQNHVAALFLSDALPRLASNGVDFANLWMGYAEQGVGFGFIQHTGGGSNMRANSPYYLYYLFNTAFGDELVQSASLDPDNVSVWASTSAESPNTLYVMVTNFDDEDISTELALQNFTARSGEVYELLPDGDLGQNSESGEKDIYSTINGNKIDLANLDASLATIAPKQLSVNGSSLVHTFPKHSVSFMVLSGDEVVDPTDQPVEPTDIPVEPTVPVDPVEPTAEPTAVVSATLVPTEPLPDAPTPVPTSVPQEPSPTREWVPQDPTSTTMPGTPQPTITVGDQEDCPRKGEGDANCDGVVNLIDFEILRQEYLGEWSSTFADFNGDGEVSLIDAQIWTDTFLTEIAA